LGNNKKQVFAVGPVPGKDGIPGVEAQSCGFVFEV